MEKLSKNYENKTAVLLNAGAWLRSVSVERDCSRPGYPSILRLALMTNCYPGNMKFVGLNRVYSQTLQICSNTLLALVSLTEEAFPPEKWGLLLWWHTIPFKETWVWRLSCCHTVPYLAWYVVVQNICYVCLNERKWSLFVGRSDPLTFWK